MSTPIQKSSETGVAVEFVNHNNIWRGQCVYTLSGKSLEVSSIVKTVKFTV